MPPESTATPDWTIYAPDLGDLYGGLIRSLLLFAILVAVGVWLSRRRGETDARLRVVLPMLVYFGALLSLISAGGNYLSTLKYPELAFSATRLSVDGEEFPMPRPNAVRIESVTDRLTRKQSNILLLQLDERRTLALPEDRYPTREIYTRIVK